LKISFNEKLFKDLLTILNDLKKLNVIQNEIFPISLEKINELEKILTNIYNKYGSNN
jgi:hypothetical protein